MRTPEQWLKHLHENTDDVFDPENVVIACDVMDVIRAAQADARAGAIEECAKVLDDRESIWKQAAEESAQGGDERNESSALRVVNALHITATYLRAIAGLP
jgi:hypothetical protein